MDLFSFFNKKEKEEPKDKELPAVLIEDAFIDLSQEAFSIWIRFMVTPQEELDKGRGYIHKFLGLSRASTDRYILELHRRGYINFVRDREKRVNKIKITKKAVILGEHKFLIL